MFLAEVATPRCGSGARPAERRFGWGRDTVAKGLHELRHRVRCLENLAARGRHRTDQKEPQLAAAIRPIVAPHTPAEPGLTSSRRSTDLSAAEVRAALIAKGDPEAGLPAERPRRDVLTRRNYRLEGIPKGRPLKTADATDAVVALGKPVRGQVRDGAETLEIARDRKAKVALGDDVGGGKDRDGRPR